MSETDKRTIHTIYLAISVTSMLCCVAKLWQGRGWEKVERSTAHEKCNEIVWLYMHTFLGRFGEFGGAVYTRICNHCIKYSKPIQNAHLTQGGSNLKFIFGVSIRHTLPYNICILVLHRLLDTYNFIGRWIDWNISRAATLSY